jgi:hypothetical protein
MDTLKTSLRKGKQHKESTKEKERTKSNDSNRIQLDQAIVKGKGCQQPVHR